jgi:ubiquinone/menaquinone biosynthesis C-methylase UbiE
LGFYANNLFPWVLDATEPKEMAEQRRFILSQVKGKVLEIGMGTGVNLPFYPEHVREISTVEPSDAMRPRVKKRENETGLIVDWHQGKGEKMPFKDEYFDTVVSADVLCTVDDVDAVLSEAFRVLKPGGKLHFLEHGLSREKRIKKRQKRLNGLSKLVGCGCQLTRNMEEHLRKSEFTIQEMEHVPLFSGMNEVYSHIRGIALKPS